MIQQATEASELSVDELAQLLGAELEMDPPLSKCERALLLAERVMPAPIIPKDLLNGTFHSPCE